jgi:hypothetical protein
LEIKEEVMTTTTHFKIAELIEIHNSIAKRKGAKPIPPGTMLSFDVIADRIEARRNKSVKRAPSERRWWLLRGLLNIRRLG